MSKQLSDDERALAAEQFLVDIDDFVNPKDNKDNKDAKNIKRNVVYQIITRPFGSRNISSRIADKLFHVPLYVLKKGFIDYLAQQSATDSALLKYAKFTAAKSLAIENELRDHTSKLFDEKIYEIMKLNDRLKSELMAEINKDVDVIGAGEKVEMKWINPASKKLTKLNLGSGSHIMNGYINVDHRAIKGVDLVCDIRQLPLTAASLDEIYTSHVVEHFTELQTRDMLRHWYDLLKPGGKLRIIVPNIESMVRQYAAGKMSWERLRMVILGGQDYSSDYHFNVYSEAYMKDLLNQIMPEAAVHTMASDRLRGEALELDVVVEKKA